MCDLFIVQNLVVQVSNNGSQLKCFQISGRYLWVVVYISELLIMLAFIRETICALSKFSSSQICMVARSGMLLQTQLSDRSPDSRRRNQQYLIQNANGPLVGFGESASAEHIDEITVNLFYTVNGMLRGRLKLKQIKIKAEKKLKIPRNICILLTGIGRIYWDV